MLKNMFIIITEDTYLSKVSGIFDVNICYIAVGHRIFLDNWGCNSATVY